MQLYSRGAWQGWRPSSSPPELATIAPAAARPQVAPLHVKCNARAAIDPRQCPNVTLEDVFNGVVEHRSRTERPLPSSPAQLTRAINECSSIHELQRLVAPSSKHPMFNAIHATATATRMAGLMDSACSKGVGPWAAAAPVQPQLNGHAHVGSGCAPDAAHINGSKPCSRSSSNHPAFLSNTVNTVAMLVSQHLDSLDARGLANCIWALARMSASLNQTASSRINGTKLNGGSHHSSSRPSCSSAPASSAPHSVASPEKSSTASGSTQQATCALRPIAARLLQRAAATDFSSFTHQHLSNTLWAAAVLHLPLSPQAVSSFFRAAEHHLAAASGQGLANTLWACAQLGMMPPDSWMARVYAVPPSTLLASGPQALSSTLWALAVLTGGRDRGGSSSGSSSSSGGSSGGSSGPLARPPAPWLRMLLSDAQPLLAGAGPQALANTLWAVQALGHVPGRAWLQAAGACTQPQLPHMAPQQLAATLWSMSRLVPHVESQGSSHSSSPHRNDSGPHDSSSRGSDRLSGSAPVLGSAWVAAAAACTAASLHLMSDQEVANASLGLARLGWRPGAGWVQQWVEALEARGLHTGHNPSSVRPLAGCVAAAAGWVVAGMGQHMHTSNGPHSLAAWLDRACGQLAAHVRQWAAVSGGDGLPRQQQRGSGTVLPDIMTALGALAAVPLPRWRVAGVGPGLVALVEQCAGLLAAQAAPANAWPGEHSCCVVLTRGEAVTLCWLLAKLQFTPHMSWLARVVTPLLGQAGAGLSEKEVGMLVWAAGAWGMAGVAGGALLQQQEAARQQSSSGGSMSVTGAAHEGGVGHGGDDPGAVSEAGSRGSGLHPSAIALALVGLARGSDARWQQWHQQQWHQQWHQQQQQQQPPVAAPHPPHVSRAAPGPTLHQPNQAAHPSAPPLKPTPPPSFPASVWPGAAPDAGMQLLQLAARHAQDMSAEDLTQALWAAARLGYAPSRAWSRAMLARVLQLLENGGLVGSGRLPLAMWSLACLRIRPARPALPAMLLACVDAVRTPCPASPPTPQGSMMRQGSAAPQQQQQVQQSPGWQVDAKQFSSVLVAVGEWGVAPSRAWWLALLGGEGWEAGVASAAGGHCMKEDGSGTAAGATSGQLHHTLQWPVSAVGVLARALPGLCDAGCVPPDFDVTGPVCDRALREAAAALAAWEEVRARGATPQPGVGDTLQLLLAATRLAVHAATSLPLSSHPPHSSAATGSDLGSEAGGQEQGLEEGAWAVAWLRAAVPLIEGLLPLAPLHMAAALSVSLAPARKHLSAGQADSLLTTLQIVTRSRLARAHPATICGLLRAFAAWRARPEPDWADAAVGALGQVLPRLGGREVAVVAAALAGARVRPGRRWMLGLVRCARAAVAGAGSPGPGAAAGVGGSSRPISVPRLAHQPQAGQQAQQGVVAARPVSVRVSGGAPPPSPAARVGGGGMTLGEVSALTSAIMRLDPELGRRWVAQLAVMYG